MMNFRSIALDGVSWSMSSQILRMVLQVFTTIILARLLSPDDFGVYAMALPVIALANLLQDIGLNQSMIQKQDMKVEQANRLFWINLVLSMALAGLIILTAPLISKFYSEPRLELVLNGWALVLLLGAFGFGHYAMLARQFRFRLLAIIDMLCATVAFLVVLFCAAIWPSYWALWFSGLSSVLMWVALTWMLSGWRPSFTQRHADIRGMFSFGLSVTAHNVANYVVRNFDNILIGRVLGPVTLGLYDRAYKLLLYPIENLGNPIGRVMIPILSRMQDDPQGYRRAYLQASGFLSLLIMPGMGVASVCAHDVVQLLLGERWLPVAAIFFWLGIAGLAQPVLIATQWLYLAEGRASDLMRVSVFSSLVIAAGFLIGIRWGAVGVAAAYACAELLVRVPLQIFFAGRGLVRHIDLIIEYVPQLIAFGFSGLMIIFLQQIDVDGWRLIALGLIIAYSNAALCMTLFPSGRYVLAAGWRLMGDIIRQLSKRLAP